MKAKQKQCAIIYQADCVACGCCENACPKSAIHVINGVFAEVSKELCIGCGKCQKACPASIIKMEDCK